MKRISLISRNILNGSYRCPLDRGQSKRQLSDDFVSTNFRMQKCLIISKMTRYEYERHRHKTSSEEEMERLLRKRGTDYDALVALHCKQKAFEQNVADTLRDMGLDLQIVSRWSYTTEMIEWCDVVIPCGGDGTFLLAASKVKDINKPVIGFNSAPNKSVGRLCLPKWCSEDIRGAVQCLKEGRFKWLHRSRIRTTITCEAKSENTITPVDLHTANFSRYAQSYETPEHVPPPECIAAAPPSNCNGVSTQLLPFLALNEVFIGESVSSRVSHLQMSVDSGPAWHTKSSGLCVATGTGSTSWHLSINCLRTQSVHDLLRLFAEEGHLDTDTSLQRARLLTDKYNSNLQFSPESSRLAYSVRELIAAKDWPTAGPRARDFASTVRVVSHCVDAGLVIDGSVSFPFNDGAVALLQTLPEDSLRTVLMLNDDA